MAYFTGTEKEFTKFIGPRLRNVVQTSIGRNYKRQIGKCEICGTTKDLELAHLHSNKRKDIMKKAFNNYINDEEIIKIELNEFEKEFASLHLPLNETFKILCRPHHREFDNIKGEIDIPEEYTENTIESSNSENNEHSNNEGVLPLNFYPEDLKAFKEDLINQKSAYITTFFKNGSTETKEWKATRFNETSDLIQNIRSRQELRQGKWQEANIVKVEVEVNYQD